MSNKISQTASDNKQKTHNDNTDQTIHRVRHDRAFVQVENSTAQDKRLSWGARGLLLYLLSLPSDWQIKVSHLIDRGDAGRDGLRRMLRELQTFGYASGFGKAEDHGDAGRFGSQSISIYETPSLNPFFLANQPTPEKPFSVQPSPEPPSPEPPSPEPPSPEKASLYKEQILQRTDLTNTHTTNTARARAGGVCVDDEKSEAKRPTREQFERYAANHRDRQGVVLGEGWIRTAQRTNDYDAQVMRWVEGRESGGGADRSAALVIMEACDECNSSGFTLASIEARAVPRKCQHPKLRANEQPTRLMLASASV
jgi:hypothetical protein